MISVSSCRDEDCAVLILLYGTDQESSDGVFWPGAQCHVWGHTRAVTGLGSAHGAWHWAKAGFVPMVHPFHWGSSNTLLLAEDIVGMRWLQCCPLEGQLLNCSKIVSFHCFVRKVTTSLSQLRINGTVWWVVGREEKKSFPDIPLAYGFISVLTSDSSTVLTSREGCWACLYLVILLHQQKTDDISSLLSTGTVACGSTKTDH